MQPWQTASRGQLFCRCGPPGRLPGLGAQPRRPALLAAPDVQEAGRGGGGARGGRGGGGGHDARAAPAGSAGAGACVCAGRVCVLARPSPQCFAAGTCASLSAELSRHPLLPSLRNRVPRSCRRSSRSCEGCRRSCRRTPPATPPRREAPPTATNNHLQPPPSVASCRHEPPQTADSFTAQPRTATWRHGPGLVSASTATIRPPSTFSFHLSPSFHLSFPPSTSRPRSTHRSCTPLATVAQGPASTAAPSAPTREATPPTAPPAAPTRTPRPVARAAPLGEEAGVERGAGGPRRARGGGEAARLRLGRG
jgi:hypothetical protein